MITLELNDKEADNLLRLLSMHSTSSEIDTNSVFERLYDEVFGTGRPTLEQIEWFNSAYAMRERTTFDGLLIKVGNK